MVKSQKIEKIPYFYLFLTATAFVVLLLTLYPYKPDFSKLSALPTPTPTISKYICPASEWVDCMPGPGPLKTQCQPDYLNWAKINCPNFKSAAL